MTEPHPPVPLLRIIDPDRQFDEQLWNQSQLTVWVSIFLIDFTFDTWFYQDTFTITESICNLQQVTLMAPTITTESWSLQLCCWIYLYNGPRILLLNKLKACLQPAKFLPIICYLLLVWSHWPFSPCWHDVPLYHITRDWKSTIRVSQQYFNFQRRTDGSKIWLCDPMTWSWPPSLLARICGW